MEQLERREMLAGDVVSTTSIPTVLGPGIDVTVNGGVTLNGTINVLATDVLAANGVVHIIDGVLLPPATV